MESNKNATIACEEAVNVAQMYDLTRSIGRGVAQHRATDDLQDLLKLEEARQTIPYGVRQRMVIRRRKGARKSSSS
jgi:hypothetical protein